MTADAGTLIDGPALLAGVSVLLHRYTDRSEFVLGYLADGQPAPTVLNVELADDSTFAELVDRVGGVLADSEAAPRDPSPPELIVAFDREPAAALARVPWLIVQSGAAEPRLELRSEGGGIAGVDDARFLSHLRTLLIAADEGAALPVAALPILAEAERRRLLEEWNDTAAAYPNECLPELVEARARAIPDDVAVVFGDDALTYAELDSRANQLARYLVGLGVGPEVLVGICVERSLEMVVGLLGIMKARGVYVPIDPEYPAERQEYMLTNSQAPVVLTQSALRDRVPSGEATVVCLDGDWPAIARLPAEAPAIPGDPEQLAYVIYTSGSTGRPKGVQISHRALVNFLTTMARTPGLSSDDVLVAVTTLSFDIAGLELYLPLVVGARVVIARSQTSGDGRALAELLERSGASVMQATPTTWRMLVDCGWRPSRALRGLCGGEALPVALADELVERGVELWNMYGPTETTIWSTCARVESGTPVTIGRPIANTSLYVLDAMMEPVPVGIPGELWIGGHGVARGYRARPDLTGERFVPDPFAAARAGRIYRTGDLVRYRDDGSVEYLGRIDHQVKVRGFRIELGEIETVLTTHAAVAAAVVVAHAGERDAELAAYVILHGVPVAPHALRQFLAQKLPAYMVPSTVTALESFPLTPNGKVDRKALPEPTRERAEGREFIAPRSALEIKLAAIWERELGISPIGVSDNFFDLGVTSIAAASLFAAIEHALGDRLPLGAIFTAPTIASLADLLEGNRASGRWTSLVPIQPGGSQPPIFCIHGGAGTILHLEPLARRLGPDQPFYGLQSKGLYGGVSSPRTVEEMASHYLAEMRQVHDGRPWRLAGYCFGALVAFELARRLRGEGEQVELVTIFNGPSPAWIRRWGWYGNQPSRRAERPEARAITRLERAARLARRLRGAMREPRRFRTALVWYARRTTAPRLARLALALGRPIPEQQREDYFLRLHAEAERAYEPQPLDVELTVFYGEGLYEDPALGWRGLTTAEIHCYAVPGVHDNNRQAMAEPFVAFVGERLQERLAAAHAAREGGGDG